MAEIGDYELEFKLSCSSSILLGRKYLEFDKIESGSAKYLTLPALELTISLELVQVLIPSETFLIP